MLPGAWRVRSWCSLCRMLFVLVSLCLHGSDRPCEQEVRKRHREYMIKVHPDKAPANEVDEYTEKAARLNSAKEIILRAQGLSDDSTSPLGRCGNEQSTAPLMRLWSQRVPLLAPAPSVQPPVCSSHF